MRRTAKPSKIVLLLIMFSAPLLQYMPTIVLSSTTAFISEVKHAAGIRFHAVYYQQGLGSSPGHLEQQDKL
jgi:hypothetical protein